MTEPRSAAGHLRGSTLENREAFPQARIGNDIVDLRHPRCRERAPGDPLLDRVLAGSERRWLDGVEDSARWLRRLWALWAAKETAYKVYSKHQPTPLPFRHRAFVAELEEETAEELPFTRILGRVQVPDPAGAVEVEGGSDGSYLHLVGWDAPLRGYRLEVGLEGDMPSEPAPGRSGADPEPTSDPLQSLRDRFTAREWQGIHSLASARVRLLARERIAAHLGLSDRGPGVSRGDLAEGSEAPVELLTSGEAPGRTPPRIRVGGRERPDLDVSLSHHGRFLAWALLLPARQPPPSPP